MKIKLDENIPLHLKVVLGGLAHDVHTTYEKGLAGEPDPHIWDAAQREQR